MLIYSLEVTFRAGFTVFILNFRIKKSTESSIKCYPGENSPKRPKDLRLLEIQSAKERLSSAKLKLKIAGMEPIKDDGKNQKTGDMGDEVSEEDTKVDEKKVKVTVNIKLTKIPPQTPPTEIRNVRPPPFPQDDENLKNDFLSGSFCLVGGGGWWKYRFCFHKRVEQFHKDEKTKIVTTIVLGTWDGQKTGTAEKLK